MTETMSARISTYFMGESPETASPSASTTEAEPRRYDRRIQHSGDDPLLAVVRQDPLEAVWFIKVVMLFSSLSGALISLPCFVFLYLYWSRCNSCSRPLHYWVLIHCIMQIGQAPVRLIFYYRLNKIIPSHMNESLRASLTGANRTLRSLAVPESNRSVPLNAAGPVRSNTNLQQGSEQQRTVALPGTTNHQGSDLSNFTDYVEDCVRQLSRSSAWKTSKLISIFTYGWFILGVVWVLNSTECAGCPGLYNLSLTVIYTAIARLIITLSAFYRSFPVQLHAMGQRKMKGAAQSVIDALPLITYPPSTNVSWETAHETDESSGIPRTTSSTESTCDSCAVCLCDFETGDRLRSLPCDHLFHRPCIDKWLKRNKVCPLCLHDIQCVHESKTKKD